MPNATCIVDDCGNRTHSRGLCNRHYKRHQSHGDVPILPRKTVASRLWDKVDKTDTCWLWTGYTTPDGYGVMAGEREGDRNRTSGVHRVSYELLVGPIPAGLEIDHLCQVRNCVNPDHLEPVTRDENARRAGVRQTHCISGHEFTEQNTRIRASDGARICRTCESGDRAEHRKGVRRGRAIS